MEVFLGTPDGSFCNLGPEEAAHCVRVLRRREGDEISVIDGFGTMYRCRLTQASPSWAQALILESFPRWGSHPYELTMAVCPTKNTDRYEWFAEKATELGVDRIVPVIGDRSERKVLRLDRLEKILLSASKQSLKAAVPKLSEPLTVKEFITLQEEGLRLFACCFDAPGKASIAEALDASTEKKITVLIGPEGDFSDEEASLALASGFLPTSLGASRLRTETAAVFAAAAVYYKFLNQ